MISLFCISFQVDLGNNVNVGQIRWLVSGIYADNALLHFDAVKSTQVLLVHGEKEPSGYWSCISRPNSNPFCSYTKAKVV